ncbi:MAG: DUF1553 domain-containing protein [Armatimonadetes bacterium]|nr:DUF1553 domain-containing protein [Armatimonadota bacterium]
MRFHRNPFLFVLLGAVGFTGPVRSAPAGPPPATATETPSFTDRIIPVLTRASCNAGACHGAASGKNGFRLSLLGYDPEGDHNSLLRQSGARRVVRFDPGASLLLRKASGAVPHAGGIRFRPDSPEYRILADWIAAGAPGVREADPVVEKIELSPANAVLVPGGRTHLRVIATYQGGRRADVTWLSRFVSNHDHIARVDSTGLAMVEPNARGEAVVRAAFRGQFAVARIAVPYRAALPPGDPWALPANAGALDQALFTSLRRLRMAPSGLCSDSEFLRRAYLDLTGSLPSPEKTREFLAACEAERRTRPSENRSQPGPQPLSSVRAPLVDELLASPGFQDLWSYRLGDLLRSNRRNLGTKGNRRFHAWLREQVGTDRPWDQIVRDLIISRGSLWDEGPANFYGTASGATELAEVTSQQFLGIRLQCAKCHDHPFDRWTQSDYYRFAAFFTRVQVKTGGERDDRVVTLADEGEIQHPRTGTTMTPRSLDGGVEGKQSDRRADLANWLTARENPWFSRSMANRVWKHLMGRGLVDPVDDLRSSNPASNEAALAVLEQAFRSSNFSLKSLVRLIAGSRAYQISATPTESNRYDEALFSRHYVRRLTAEQIMDSLVAATGVPERYSGRPLGTRAAQLEDTSVPSYLLDVFGRPARDNVCECEREADPNLAQVLHVMNGETVNGKLLASDGRLRKLLSENRPDAAIVEELFLATVIRRPTPRELKGALDAVHRAPSRPEAFSDLFWALLNSREFLFTH